MKWNEVKDNETLASYIKEQHTAVKNTLDEMKEHARHKIDELKVQVNHMDGSELHSDHLLGTVETTTRQLNCITAYKAELHGQLRAYEDALRALENISGEKL